MPHLGQHNLFPSPEPLPEELDDFPLFPLTPESPLSLGGPITILRTGEVVTNPLIT